VISFIASATATAKLRYVNSMPQFGKATVKAIPPYATIFDSVPPVELTSYVNFTSIFTVLITTYKTNVTALSIPYFIDSSKFYTLYTSQIQSRLVTNLLVEDKTTSSNSNKAELRCINLLQYNFDIDVFNSSNNALIFDNVSYGEVTPYKSVPPGDYQLYWEANSKKRSEQQLPGSNATFDPFLFAGRTYTHWVLPTISFIVRDGSLNPARKRDISTTKDRRIKEEEDKPRVDTKTSLESSNANKKAAVKRKLARSRR